jgi:3-methyladenine DNA glycosylase/8-oxoguanine DNA glycosylase
VQTVGAHGWSGVEPFRWDRKRRSLWRAEELPDGSVHGFYLAQPGGKGGSVRIRWHSGGSRPQRFLLLARTRRMLSLEVDLRPFHALCRDQPPLRYVPSAGAGRFLRCGGVYEEVFKGICATNIAWRQAVMAMNRVAALGKPVPGVEQARAFPSPSAILRLREAPLRALSRLGYRVSFLRSWARRVEEGAPEIAAIESSALEREAVRRFLLSIPGIGKATSRYLMMVWGDGREISVDSSVYLYFRHNRFEGRRPAEAEILSLYEPFGDWRAHAYWFEFLPWARKHYKL